MWTREIYLFIWLLTHLLTYLLIFLLMQKISKIYVNLPGGRAERYSFVNPRTKIGMDERDSSKNPAFWGGHLLSVDPWWDCCGH